MKTREILGYIEDCNWLIANIETTYFPGDATGLDACHLTVALADRDRYEDMVRANGDAYMLNADPSNGRAPCDAYAIA